MRLVALTTFALLLLVPLVSNPARAAADEPRVIAVHTASAPRVSMVLAALAAQPDKELTPDAVSVTIGGSKVDTTVTPMASDNLSVALVIDTAADLTPELLTRVQSGMAEYLLRLPEGANTMVVTTGGDPRIVAPLSRQPADALSAISAIRVAGSRSTAAGTILAAQELAKAPAGPRAIIVYTNGPDDGGASTEEVTQAVSQAEAVLNVVQTREDDLWSQVVDRAGGAVHPTETSDIVPTYRRLATALSDQYLLTFQVQDELPAAAEVSVTTGDVRSSTEVTLPTADQAADTAEQPSEQQPAGREMAPIAIMLFGLVPIVLALIVAILRARRRAAVGTEMPLAFGSQASTASQASELAVAPNKDARPGPPTGGGPQGPQTAAPATSPPQRRSRRGSLTDAVRGMRSAQQAMASQTEQELGRRPPHDQQQRAPDERQPRPQAPDKPIRQGKTRPELRVAPLLSRIGSRIAGRVAAVKYERVAEAGGDEEIAFTGTGDATVERTKNAARWPLLSRRRLAVHLVLGDDPVDAVSVLTLYLVLLIGIPAQLVFSPLGAAGTPAQMLAIGLLVWWSARRLARLEQEFPATHPISRATLVFALVLVASYYAAATRPIEAVELRAADRGLLSLCAWAGIVLVITDGLPTRDRLDVLLRRLVLAVGVLAALGIAQFLTGLNIVEYIQIPGLVANTDYFGTVLDRSDFVRPAATATHPIEFGFVLAMAMPIALHYSLYGNTAAWRRWLPVMLIAIAVPISISRSAILGAAVAVAFLLPTWPARRRGRAYVAITGLMLLIYVAMPGLLGTLRNLFFSLLGGVDSSIVSRTNSYAIAGEYITERPVLGRGFGTFLPSAHILDNQYLITTIEAGLAGVFALLGLFITGVFTARVVRRRSSDPTVRNLAQSLAAAVAVGMVSFATFDALSFAMAAGMTFFVLGCIGAMWRLHVVLPGRLDATSDEASSL